MTVTPYRYENNERNTEGFNKAKSWEGEKNAEISAFVGVMSRYEKKAKTLIHRLNNFSLRPPVWTQFFFSFVTVQAVKDHDIK